MIGALFPFVSTVHQSQPSRYIHRATQVCEVWDGRAASTLSPLDWGCSACIEAPTSGSWTNESGRPESKRVRPRSAACGSSVAGVGKEKKKREATGPPVFLVNWCNRLGLSARPEANHGPKTRRGPTLVCRKRQGTPAAASGMIMDLNRPSHPMYLCSRSYSPSSHSSPRGIPILIKYPMCPSGINIVQPQ